MATQPTLLPEWASQDQNDPVTGAPNKVEPTASFKLSGVNRDQAIIRPYLNFNLDLTSDWLAHLRDATESATDAITGTSTVITIPTQEDATYQVAVTPLADTTGIRIWVTTKTTTSFTINTSAALSINVDWILSNK